jgi:exosome complex component RRP46
MPAATVSSINTLQNPDGSSQYTFLGYTAIGSVNGPVEVSRRDELPEEATLEVNIRPAMGVGSTLLDIRPLWLQYANMYKAPRDRHLESVLHSAFRRIILTHQFPRTLIQLTLQMLQSPPSTSLSHLPGSLRHSVCLKLSLKSLLLTVCRHSHFCRPS